MHSTVARNQQALTLSRPPEQANTPKKKCSFRDKLLSMRDLLPRRETTDLIGNNLFRIEYEDGDRRRP
jgi:hypothetical protein